MEDTEWNDILRNKGIIPKEVELKEEDIIGMMETVIDRKINGKSLDERNLEELDELEDDEDERVLLQYRQQRIAEMKENAAKNMFGELQQISKPDYQTHVTEANYLPDCKLVNQHLQTLAKLHKNIKFLKIVANQCIPNYPDRNCPTILIYGKGELQLQLVGMGKMGTIALLETVLLATGAIDECKYDEPEEDCDSDDGY